MPAIIMIQVMEAAAGRRCGSTRVDSKANKEVPEAPTPPPIIENAATAMRVASTGDCAIITVASVAIYTLVSVVEAPVMRRFGPAAR